MIEQIVNETDAALSGNADTLARNTIATLELHYPSFKGLWRVKVNEAGGVLEIINLALSGRWGFMLHISKMDSEGRKVVRCAGELLERYNVSRSKNVAVESILMLPRNYRGELVAQT